MLQKYPDTDYYQDDSAYEFGLKASGDCISKSYSKQASAYAEDE